MDFGDSLSSTNSDSDSEVVIFPGRHRQNVQVQTLRNDKPPSAERGWLSAKAKEDAILADYISNIRDNDGAPDKLQGKPLLRLRDLGLGECDEELKGFAFVGAEDTDRIIHDEDDWNSRDLRDFDGFSTSSEPMHPPPRILKERSNGSEIQYLVIAEGASLDEARWLALDQLRVPGTEEILDLFEEKQSILEHTSDHNDESDDSSVLRSQKIPDLYKDRGAMRDTRNVDSSWKARTSDEHIARLSSRQAELGIIGGELVSFTNDETETNCSGKLPANGATAIPRDSLKRDGKKKKTSGDAYSQAAAFIDTVEESYSGFDIMDHDRPSLGKNFKRGRRNQTKLDLIDSDLQQSIVAAWENDRVRKKRRKQEREDLRKQGLLGKKGKSMHEAKFGGGITMGDLNREIKDFLESSAHSRPLPPMGQKERKNVHGIAHKSGLKSKSVGSGAARFPVLYKTSQTRKFNLELGAQIDAMFNPQSPHKAKARMKGLHANQSGKGDMAAAASYKEGEIVGVGAPELGHENKGRAMLEKMGWSMGTSLGAFNNKGIVQPIEQIVKTSKAGLG